MAQRKLSSKNMSRKSKLSTKSKKHSIKSLTKAFAEMTGGNPFIVKYNNLQLKGGKKKKKGSKKKGSKKKGSKKKVPKRNK